jgi:hypothetical protein
VADSHTDRQADNDAGRWMSYAQLAEIRGISKKAAQRLTLRHQWRRQPANDGGVLIWVPDDATIRSRQTGRQNGVSDGPDVVAFFEDANRRADEAHKRADAALALADRLGAQLADAGGRADRAEARVAELQRDLDAARVIAGATQHDAQAAQADAQAAQADAQKAQDASEELRKENEARKARGRLRRAWDGWRGR